VASLGHVAIGLFAAELAQLTRPQPSRVYYWRDVVRYSALALLPDADVLAFGFGIPYAHDFGHRGASHSLSFAIVIGALVFVLTRAKPVALLAGAVVATHGPLDMLTDGGLGVALFWPIDSQRYFFPWTPIPVAPIGAGMISARGLYVVITELIYFSPLLLAVLWIRRSTR
jgi:inner membrane protein